MKFPHSLSCGHTFEKDALDQWLILQRFCPTCRTPTEGLTVVIWALKSVIERFNTASSQSVNSNAVILNNTNIQDRNLTDHSSQINLKSQSQAFKNNEPGALTSLNRSVNNSNSSAR